jgi:hypothetical protein
MFDAMPGDVGQQFRDWIDFREIEKPLYAGGQKVGTRTVYVANPHVLHLMRNLPSARITATGGQFIDESVPMDNKLLNFLTGFRKYDIDVEEQRYFRELGRKEQLQKYLLQLGVAKDYNRLYIPKK